MIGEKGTNLSLLTFADYSSCYLFFGARPESVSCLPTTRCRYADTIGLLHYYIGRNQKLGKIGKAWEERAARGMKKCRKKNNSEGNKKSIGSNERQKNGGKSGKKQQANWMEERHGKERQASERRKCMGMNDRQRNERKAGEGMKGKERNDRHRNEGKASEERTGKGTQERHGKNNRQENDGKAWEETTGQRTGKVWEETISKIKRKDIGRKDRQVKRGKA
jgi:hypothetical protein